MSNQRCDAQELRTIIERKLLRAAFTAISKLAREAADHPVITSEQQFRACAVLARLASAVLARLPATEPYCDPIHPAYRDQAERLMDEMDEIRAQLSAEKHPEPRQLND